MTLSYKISYSGTHVRQLIDWCRVSRNLYNQTLFHIKEIFESTKQFPSKFDLIARMQSVTNLEGECNYRLLKAQCAQQCVMQAHTAYVTYFKTLKDWKKNPKKYHSMPMPPKYKKRGSWNSVLFTNQDSKFKDGILMLRRDIKIPVPNYDRLLQMTKYCGARIVPVSDSEVSICIMYKVPDAEPVVS